MAIRSSYVGNPQLFSFPRDACISAAYAVVRCLSLTFMYCVETSQDTAIVAIECEYIGNRTQAFERYHFPLPKFQGHAII